MLNVHNLLLSLLLTLYEAMLAGPGLRHIVQYLKDIVGTLIYNNLWDTLFHRSALPF